MAFTAGSWEDVKGIARSHDLGPVPLGNFREEREAVTRQALYRTYRPRRFGDVVGQDAQVRVLKEAVRQGQLTHAYLLAGPRGTGKTSVARILAEAATCVGPVDGEPCGTCASCRAQESGGHLDIVEIDAASNRGIDEVRDLKERVLHAPALGRRKVYIVDEVHMLTPEAFNAFLKTLEEPPDHVLFIFATTEPHKLPITVLSRFQRYDFQRIPDPDIVKNLRYVLEKEGQTFEEAALIRLAEASEGGLRDAQSLLDQVLAGGPVTEQRVNDLLGILDESQLTQVVCALLEGDAARVLTVADEAYRAGRDARHMLREVARRLRDLWVLHVVGPESLPTHRAARLLRDYPSCHVDHAHWLSALDQLAEAETRLRGSFPPRLVVELGLLKAMQGLRGTTAAVPQPSDLRVVARPDAESGVRAASQKASPVVSASPPEPPSEIPREEPRGGEAVVPRDFEKVLELLKNRRLTAALFRHVTVIENADQVEVRFQYPAHFRVLDDEKSGHRQLFLECFRTIYGDKSIVFAVDGDGPRPDGSPDAHDTQGSGNVDDEFIQRSREVFGPEVPVRVIPASRSQVDSSDARSER